MKTKRQRRDVAAMGWRPLAVATLGIGSANVYRLRDEAMAKGRHADPS
jgi:hypothetical protein